MMQRAKSLATLCLTLLVLSNCAKTPVQPDTNTTVFAPTIALKPAPRPVELTNIKWYVVNQDNIEQFTKDMTLTGDNKFVFVAMSVQDYEVLSLNLDELRRYINQQGSLIVYYENAIKANNAIH